MTGYDIAYQFWTCVLIFMIISPFLMIYFFRQAWATGKMRLYLKEIYTVTSRISRHNELKERLFVEQSTFNFKLLQEQIIEVERVIERDIRTLEKYMNCWEITERQRDILKELLAKLKAVELVKIA